MFINVLVLAWLAFELALWPWAVGAIALSHLSLCLSVLLPRASLLGPNLTRLPQAAVARREVALTFDDGPDPEITPRILDLLEARGMRASFFCIAERALAWPELMREIVRRGHQVENHSFDHHPGFSFYPYGRLGREVDAAQSALAQLTERAPRFFRAPAGFRSPMLDPVLARRGLRYVSWTRRGYDAVSREPARVLQRLERGLAAGDILLLHDGSAARTAAGVPVVLEVLPPLLERLRALGLTSVPLGVACGDTLLEEKRAS
jgi:peptidoglycan/xylan/chitin deacetylase (PgdA/CDA1 family)